MEIQVLLLVLAAVFLFPLPPSSAQPYFQVALQWPPSLCTANPNTCVRNVPRLFKLHGLWPDNYDPSNPRAPTPEKCRPQLAFSAAAIPPAQRRALKQHWPSIYKAQSDMDFWRHQWDKHGTCAVPLGQRQYFDEAIALFNNININAMLFNLPPPAVGLRIGATNTFSGVRAAIVARLGVLPRLRCNVHNMTMQTEQLQEVVICCDAQAQRYINCPSVRASNCPATFYLP